MKRKVRLRELLCRLRHAYRQCDQAPHLEACKRCGTIRWIDPAAETAHRARLGLAE